MDIKLAALLLCFTTFAHSVRAEVSDCTPLSDCGGKCQLWEKCAEDNENCSVLGISAGILYTCKLNLLLIIGVAIGVVIVISCLGTICGCLARKCC